jgi:hypothetical protein
MFGTIGMEMAKEDLRLKVKELKADTKLSDEERAVVKADLLFNVNAFKQAIDTTMKMPLFKDDLSKQAISAVIAEHMEFINEITMELKTIEIAGEADMNIEELRFQFDLEDTYKDIVEMVNIVKQAYADNAIPKEEYDEAKRALIESNNKMRSYKGTENYAPTPELAELVDELVDNVDKLIESM